MRKIHAAVTLILALALLSSLIVWRKTQRDLREQLNIVSDANNALRESLGELTVAGTDKDKEIDRLLQMPCATPVPKPDSQTLPPTKDRDQAPRAHLVPSRAN